MKQRTIYASNIDYDRLTGLIKERTGSAKDEVHLKELQEELGRAKVVDPRKIPADVVTMNSKVVVEDLESGEEMTCTLVYPQDANLDENKISVLAPIGTAILGYKAGAKVKWKVPAGVKTFLIKELHYQPEAAGDFHL